MAIRLGPTRAWQVRTFRVAAGVLLLAGLLGGFEAARAQTVIWSATLTAESGNLGREGHDRLEGYGTLSSRTFTYKGKSFFLNTIYSSNSFTYMEFSAGSGHVEKDLFGTSSNPRPVTLNIGSGSWMSPTGYPVANFGGTPVMISVAGGTATAGTDFSAVNEFTLTIAGGATSGTATFDLVPLDDGTHEPDETVTVTGETTVPGLDVEPEGGLTVTLADDEAAPQVTLVLDPDSVSEKDGSSTVTATLDRPSSEDTTIMVSAAPVSPATRDDFTLSAAKTLTIAAGDRTSSGTVMVAANDNGVDDGSRSVTVSGTAANDQGVEQPDPRTLTITDDDETSTTVTLAVSPASVSEGAAQGARTVTVTATLDKGARTEAAEVTVSVSGGTATAGTDYTAVAPFTVTIDAGAKTGTGAFDLVPIDDATDEPDETVTVTGTTQASGLTVVPGTGVTVTLANDDPDPVASLVLTPAAIAEDTGSSTVPSPCATS